MTALTPGLVHTPVTPFAPDRRIDWNIYERLIAFHLSQGAESLAVPMHCGESVSLTDEEQRVLVEFAIAKVAGCVPVIVHVSDSGTSIAAARATHAAEAGAAAIVATTPYYWTPPPAMIIEHFAQIGAAVRIPLFVHYTPDEMGGGKFNAEMVLKLMDRLENFVGVVDASLDWQFMTSMMVHARLRRPDFQLLAGLEYMVSAGTVGATSLFSPLSGVAPVLIRKLYDICRRESYFEARQVQEAVATLRQAVKQGGVGGLKGAMRCMGRDCGNPRPPLRPLSGEAHGRLEAALEGMDFLGTEPRGW
jgi:4-hydroxy-tetrahydrodipicolinate synthase